MATKSKKTTKKASGKVKAGGGLSGVVAKGASALLGGKSKGSSGGRRRHGVEYWAKKVLVERLKKKYFKTKYGSVR